VARVGSVRIETNYAGIGELLKRSETNAMLEHKANAVGDQAKAHTPLVENGKVPMPITVEDRPLSKRCRWRVVADHPAGEAVEAKYRLLAGSLDAAKSA